MYEKNMKPNIDDEILFKIDKESSCFLNVSSCFLNVSFCGESEYTTKVIAINDFNKSRFQEYLVPFERGWLLSKCLYDFSFSCSDIDKYLNTRVAWIKEEYIIEVMPCGEPYVCS